jgi:hypothetical protein
MRWSEILRRLFNHEAVIIVLKGYWKTGKTNVGLKIAEDLLKLGVVQLIGTNIKVKETDTLKYIEDFETLKKFHYDDPRRPKSKLFILDEAGKIAVKRGAMRSINVEWMKFLPELSKGKMKLLVITQSEHLTDSIFTNTQFTRGTLTTHKSREFGYSVSIVSELLPDYQIFINNFPKTTIDYAPYGSAEFFIEARVTDEARELQCCKIAKMYAIEKLSTVKISNRTGWERNKIVRYIKMHIRHTFGQLTDEDIAEIHERGSEEPQTLSNSGGVPEPVPVTLLDKGVEGS